MITQEKEKVKKYAKARNNKKEITIETMNNKYARRWRILLYAIILIFIILALIVTYILNVFDMAIYNPYETKVIEISSKDKNWYKNENINFSFCNVADDGVCVWTKSAEKYNGYGFPVRSSHCERNNQEESKPFESGCSFKNITDDGDYFVVGCFGTEEYSES